MASADVPPGSICEVALRSRAPDWRGGVDPRHRQRHFPEAEVLAALARPGWNASTSTAMASTASPRQPLDEPVHTKAIYIARIAG